VAAGGGVVYGNMRLNIFTSVLAGIGVLVLLYHFRDADWTPLRVAAAVVGMTGIVLLMVARYQLGRSFSVSAKANKLVTTGLYSRVRNPIYVSGCVFFVGVAMFLPSWWPIVLLVVVVPLQVKRSRNEAAVLEAAFGEEYRVYRRGTWF
jgi:protein-S-isoprenylcysteine O-methyltransferase Ste14